MNKTNLLLLSIFLVYILVFQVSAASTLSYENRLNFGHVVVIRDISTEPETLIPGQDSVLKMIVENTGNQFVNDIVISFNTTAEVALTNDISQKKIARLESGEAKGVVFNIIILPSAGEGVYKPKLTTEYVNHVGEERREVAEIGLEVKATPEIFAQVESSEIYKGNDIGTVTIKFVNNGLGDAKFFTLELLDSEDYEIISEKKLYIGDIDSDDFDSADFRIKLNKEKTTELVLKADYRDALNWAYSKEFRLLLEVRSAKDLGIKTNGTSTIVVIIIILALAGYFIYKRYKKKKNKSVLSR